MIRSTSLLYFLVTTGESCILTFGYSPIGTIYRGLSVFYCCAAAF